MTETARRYMGNSVPRKEDPAFLTGHANWTDNIKLPGILHMALLRSPYEHARNTSIDVSAAKEQPGVVAVYTDEDPGTFGTPSVSASGKTTCTPLEGKITASPLPKLSAALSSRL